jgi:hypothetical protein
MKKSILVLFLAIVAANTKTVLANPAVCKDASSVSVVVNDGQSKLSEREAQQLVNRLKEMRAMDANALTTEQKHKLRKEVLGIQEKLYPGGVYISGGALILIIILLIIFL